MFGKKNSAREARQANIDARMAHPSMDVNRQFLLITDLMPDVALEGARHLMFEVSE